MATYAPLFPLFLLIIVALVAMLMSAYIEDGAKVGWFSVAGLLGVGSLTIAQWTAATAPFHMLANAVTIDGFTHFFWLLFCIIGAVSAAMAVPYLDRDRAQRGEYYTMMLFAVVGTFVMVASDDLMTLFLGLETMSLAIYVMVGWKRHLLRSNEATLKYFFLGSLGAAIFLYGIALMYGASGTSNLVTMSSQLAGSPALGSNPVFILGALLTLAAIAFKIAAFPFHMWTPDVYEGAPAPVTAFMATAVKAAAFALLLRVTLAVFSTGQLHEIGIAVGWHLAILTMFVGNVFALAQTNVKRMLAYSSIAHTGYLLIGIISLPDPDAGAALMVYLVAYAFTNLGALACVTFLAGRDEKLESLADYAGVGWRYPLVGLGMAICMFSLIGFPPTAGFFGKYYLFLAAVKAGFTPLVIVAALNSLLSVFYYLRIIVTMYMLPAGDADRTADGSVPVATKAVIAYASIAVVWAGIGTTSMTAFLPGAAPLLNSAKASMRSLTSVSDAPPPPPAAAPERLGGER
jgi:NADH-quinone oxidoreductase subunit N